MASTSKNSGAVTCVTWAHSIWIVPVGRKLEPGAAHGLHFADDAASVLENDDVDLGGGMRGRRQAQY